MRNKGTEGDGIDEDSKKKIEWTPRRRSRHRLSTPDHGAQQSKTSEPQPSIGSVYGSIDELLNLRQNRKREIIKEYSCRLRKKKIMIEVVLDDRLGKKIRVKCNEDDTIGDLKKLAAAQVRIA